MNSGLGYLAAALTVGIAGIGAGIAVGSGAPAAIGALTEDPKSFGKALIFVVWAKASRCTACLSPSSSAPGCKP